MTLLSLIMVLFLEREHSVTFQERISTEDLAVGWFLPEKSDRQNNVKIQI